jgi:uncharacterized protein
VNDTLPNGMSALVLAAHSGQGKAAQALLEKGADPNADGIGYTALHAAVLRGEVDLVTDLLRHGAKPDAPITKGTPLRRNSQDYNLPATLIGATPYWLAAKFIEPEIMRALAAGGANTELALGDGTTPLMAAAGIKEGNGRGAAPEQDRRGISLIDGGRLPEEKRIAEAVEVALLQPVRVDAVNRNGDTALHAAALLGYDSVVTLLAGKGANLSLKNNRGLTPLAALAGRSDGARASGNARPPEILHPSTAELLRKLGAVE